MKTKDLTQLYHRFQTRFQKQFCGGIKIYDMVGGLFVCLNVFCTRNLRNIITFSSITHCNPKMHFKRQVKNIWISLICTQV